MRSSEVGPAVVAETVTVGVGALRVVVASGGREVSGAEPGRSEGRGMRLIDRDRLVVPSSS